MAGRSVLAHPPIYPPDDVICPSVFNFHLFFFCFFSFFFPGPVMFHVRRRPADSNSQAARRRKKKLSGSGSTGGGNASTSTINRLAVAGGGPGGDAASPEDPSDRLPYLVELNPDGSEVRQGNQTRRHVIAPTVTEVGSERPAPPHPSSPVAGKQQLLLLLLIIIYLAQSNIHPSPKLCLLK